MGPDAEDVPDSGDCIEVVYSEQNTLTGQIMMAWKGSHADLLRDFACAAFLISPNPIFKNMLFTIVTS